MYVIFSIREILRINVFLCSIRELAKVETWIWASTNPSENC